MWVGSAEDDFDVGWSAIGTFGHGQGEGVGAGVDVHREAAHCGAGVLAADIKGNVHGHSGSAPGEANGNGGALADGAEVFRVVVDDEVFDGACSLEVGLGAAIEPHAMGFAFGDSHGRRFWQLERVITCRRRHHDDATGERNRAENVRNELFGIRDHEQILSLRSGGAGTKAFVARLGAP